MMRSLIARLFHRAPQPSPMKRTLIDIENVAPAPLPNPIIARQTQECQVQLVQELLALGRKSAELKMTLGQATLSKVRGSHHAGTNQ